MFIWNTDPNVKTTISQLDGILQRKLDAARKAELSAELQPNEIKAAMFSLNRK